RSSMRIAPDERRVCPRRRHIRLDLPDLRSRLADEHVWGSVRVSQCSRRARRSVKIGRMLEAFVWGALGASALLVGALVSYVFTPGRQVVALVMALGAGLLIGSVSFELIDEALKTSTVGLVGLVALLGAAVFAVGDWALDRRGAADRKDPTGKQADGSPLA